MSRYFVNTGDGVELVDNEEAACELAQDAMDGWRDCCDPGWPDEVQHACWGEVRESSVPSYSGENDEYVNYTLQPIEED